MPIVSVVLSFRNEAPVLDELIARLTRALESSHVGHELIFVNDASSDGSLDILRQHAATDPRIKVITMSRTFGVSECALAGLRAATGDAAILMDTDLQDPPEVIPTLITHWRSGVEVVHTVRTARHGESATKMRLTRLAYRILRRMADIDLREDAGDFKLLGRRAVDAVLQLPETDPYLRGLISWVGFRQDYVPYERAARHAGTTHFPFFSVNPWRTFLSGLTSFSVTPLLVLLPLAGVLGLASAITAIAALVTDARLLIWVVALLLGLSSLHLFGLGVLGLYLARIYRDGRRRPAYIVDHTIGLPTPGDRP
jgi:dolichol-phosphate mannosyltransferase